MSVGTTPTNTSGGAVPSVSLAYPTALSSNPGGIGDMFVIMVGYGNSTAAAPATPAGFTLLASQYGGAGSWGLNTGPRGVIVFYRVSDGSETGSVTIVNGGTGTDRATRGVMFRVGNDGAGGWATPVAAAATDSTLNTTLGITPGSNPGGVTGDLVLAAAAWAPSGNNTVGSIASAISWPGAVTSSATVQQVNGTAANGNAVRLNTYLAPVSGTATGNVALNLTTSAAVSGAGVLVRLRSTSAVAPTADAGPNQTGIEPWSTVILDGTNSSGTISTYTWTQTIVGSEADVTSSWTGTGAKRTFTMPATVAAMTYTFTLQVTDPNGLVSNVDTTTRRSAAPTEYATSGGVLVPLRIQAEG